ncbi:hypothetical protein P8452_28037 [Trifolium repens]|nr:hypothetical protein P8452_28037 [Trifolium repens]
MLEKPPPPPPPKPSPKQQATTKVIAGATNTSITAQRTRPPTQHQPHTGCATSKCNHTTTLPPLLHLITSNHPHHPTQYQHSPKPTNRRPVAATNTTSHANPTAPSPHHNHH